MRHFIGGAAVTFLATTIYSILVLGKDGRRLDLGDASLVGAYFAIFGGLAAWGLLP